MDKLMGTIFIVVAIAIAVIFYLNCLPIQSVAGYLGVLLIAWLVGVLIAIGVEGIKGTL